MKNIVKLILLSVLVFALAAFTAACKGKDGSEGETETKMTLELVRVDEGSTIEGLEEDEKSYYTLSGYTFSDEDAAIVTTAADYPYYYNPDFYDGKKSETDYQAEKERYEQLSYLTLPTAVKVSAAESKLTITAEDLSKAENGVIDLSAGAENAKTVYIRAIKASALLNHTELKSLTVPDGYLEIGDGALSGCSNLEEIVLPFIGSKCGAVNGGKNFGYIFGTVDYTGSVVATQSYNLSGSATYYVPSKLEKVTVSSDLPAYAFYGVPTIKEVIYPAMEEIPDFAFRGCTGIKNVSLDSGVKSIGVSAFESCTSLIGVNFDELNSLETIKENAFANCTKLCYSDKLLTVPSSVTTIGAQAFVNCTSIEKLVVNATGEVRIYAAAFSGLSSLKETELTGAKMSIGTFAGWSDMLVVTVGAGTVTVSYNETVQSDSEIVGGLGLAFVGAFEDENEGQKANIEFK
ncbi:MAG: leucine-rich repeat domain-containing protein [Clostridia bacterium]|nr:leucine-rich repeat domain-containing protein [Clostridia bacterium]